MRRGGERVVGLELDHRPVATPIATSASSSGWNCAQSAARCPPRSCSRPEVVAERLDHVIGRDADVRRALLDHLEHRLQHADHRAERPVALGEAAQAVEVAEQLVGAVDQVDDHLSDSLQTVGRPYGVLPPAPPTGIPIAPSGYRIPRSAALAGAPIASRDERLRTSTLWRISAFEQARNAGKLGGPNDDRPTLLPTTLLADLQQLYGDPVNNDVLEVIAACVRNREAALLYLQHGNNVWPVTLFPREEVYHSPRDASQMAGAGMGTLRVISAEPPGVKPPATRCTSASPAATATTRSPVCSGGAVALQGPRTSLLTEISGRVAYRSSRAPIRRTCRRRSARSRRR
jgi:hypothetical protein